MSTDFEVTAIALLKSIDASLKQILGARQANAPRTVASDRDLDGQYGNPVVKFMPRDWTGQSFKGKKMSDCPPALLDMLAETFEYFATKAEEKDEKTTGGKPVAPFKRADAARARGWAKRIREGKHTPSVSPAAAKGASNAWTEESEWP
jgi:hypothetical protein